MPFSTWPTFGAAAAMRCVEVGATGGDLPLTRIAGRSVGPSWAQISQRSPILMSLPPMVIVTRSVSGQSASNWLGGGGPAALAAEPSCYRSSRRRSSRRCSHGCAIPGRATPGSSGWSAGSRSDPLSARGFPGPTRRSRRARRNAAGRSSPRRRRWWEVQAVRGRRLRQRERHGDTWVSVSLCNGSYFHSITSVTLLKVAVKQPNRPRMQNSPRSHCAE